MKFEFWWGVKFGGEVWFGPFGGCEVFFHQGGEVWR